jgi:imidazole glycerol-phosphate synthase subunit HisH
MKIAVIKYNAGNIYSVVHALRRLGIEPLVTGDHEAIMSADKVLFPGVGEASSTMAYLRARKMDMLIKDLKQPVLGICIGLQLMCRFSEEGNTNCIGIFDADVKKFIPSKQSGKVPHMGWNTIEGLQTGLFSKDLEKSYVYYVHSFYAEVCKQTIARTNYLSEFSAALHKDNFYATQFHPEKSGPVGERILSNFLAL